MNRLALSPPAAALLRALLARVGLDRDRILLIEVRSVDWQSLTFTGERHVIALRIAGPNADGLLAKLGDGLEDAEFALSGQIVADIKVAGSPERGADGSLHVRIEALTICE